ncbi:hypothetical protein SDC9_171856 [bioreactor metagenome]|uniref:Uncharacterized protein n=1 Tax=bioreactor metagenome TaxID=1076179 RepID=A0A645GC16_9ZZZZ
MAFYGARGSDGEAAHAHEFLQDRRSAGHARLDRGSEKLVQTVPGGGPARDAAPRRDRHVRPEGDRQEDQPRRKHQGPDVGAL